MAHEVNKVGQLIDVTHSNNFHESLEQFSGLRIRKSEKLKKGDRNMVQGQVFLKGGGLTLFLFHFFNFYHFYI